MCPSTSPAWVAGVWHFDPARIQVHPTGQGTGHHGLTPVGSCSVFCIIPFSTAPFNIFSQLHQTLQQTTFPLHALASSRVEPPVFRPAHSGLFAGVCWREKVVGVEFPWTCFRLSSRSGLTSGCNHVSPLLLLSFLFLELSSFLHNQKSPTRGVPGMMETCARIALRPLSSSIRDRSIAFALAIGAL